jgi:hypothetical protein
MLESRYMEMAAREAGISVPEGFTIRVDGWDDNHYPDGDCYDSDDRDAHSRGEWTYRRLNVRVYAARCELTDNWLVSVEHGTMGDGTEVDAMRVTASYMDDEGAYYAGSPLGCLIEDSIGEALEICATLGAIATREAGKGL